MDEENLQNQLDFTQPAFSGPTYADLFANSKFLHRVSRRKFRYLSAPAIRRQVLTTESTTTADTTAGTAAGTYAGINYMVSMGSATGTLQRYPFPDRRHRLLQLGGQPAQGDRRRFQHGLHERVDP